VLTQNSHCHWLRLGSHSATPGSVAQAHQVWSSRHCTATAQHCCMLPRQTKCGPPGTAHPQRSIVACCPGKPSVVLQALHSHSAALLHVAQAHHVVLQALHSHSAALLHVAQAHLLGPLYLKEARAHRSGS